MATIDDFTMPIRPLKRQDTGSSAKSWRSIFSMPGDKGEDKKSNQIVVYDPLNKRLWCEDREEFVKGQKSFVCVHIPGTELKVNVFRELPRRKDASHVSASPKPGDSDGRRPSVAGAHRETAKLLIATVNLERLGSFAKKQRKKRNMQHIYVIGSNPMGFGSVQEEEYGGGI